MIRYFILVMVVAACGATVSFGQSELLTVTSRGVGVSETDARKDALVNAMRQAVGSFMDSETLIENDQIIKDKLLSVSDGFVQSYDIIDGPETRTDGLTEITIKAVVKKGKVIERLREVNVMQGNVEGKDAAAEVITKIANADDGIALLHRHLDGLLEKLLVARLVGADGKPSESVRPTVEIQKDRSLKCTWNIEIYFDMNAFYNQVVPQLDKVFRAVSDGKGGDMVCVRKRSDRKMPVTGYPILGYPQWQGTRPTLDSRPDSPNYVIALSTGRDKLGENERFRWYALNRNFYVESINKIISKSWRVHLHFYAMNSNGGVIREEIITMGPDSDNPRYFPAFFVNAPLSHGGWETCRVLSPRLTNSREYYQSCSDATLIPYSIAIAQEDLENISQVRFRFATP